MVSVKLMMKRSLPLGTALLMSACTIVPYDQAPKNRPSTPTPERQSVVVESKPQEALLVPQQPVKQLNATEAPKSLPAAQKMRQLASVQGEKGDYKRAVALLERALRISPRDPETYYELARNHLLMDDPAQALQLAQRGLSLKPSSSLRHQLEQLIDDCKARLTA